MATETTKLTFVEGAAASTPAAGRGVIYFKADGLLYSKDDAGVETLCSAGSAGIAATIFDAKGDIIAATAADTAARLAVGTNGQSLVARSSASTGLAYETPTGLLAIAQYAPTSQTIYSITGTAMADVDATNLQITFTAPASTNVLVRLSAFGDITAGNEAYWGLRESTTNLTGIARVLRATLEEGYLSVSFYLAGISAGAHTYKWSAGVNSGATHRIITQDGSAIGEWGPAIMEVWVAP